MVEPILSFLLPFIITGVVTGLAIFGANVLLDHYRRPSLSFDKRGFSKGIRIQISLYNLNIPDLKELNELKVSYLVTRATIENNTNNVVENCKGVLRKDDIEEKLCWTVPQERYTMTINSHSKEFLDVCAILEETPQSIYDQLQTNIAKFGNDGQGVRATYLVKSLYSKIQDIPLIITPTENGWMEAHLNRKIQAGEATLLVTSKNAKHTLNLDIKILNKPNSAGKFVELK